MPEYVKVVVDGMGGDHAPAAPVQGAVEALSRSKEIVIYLTGDKDAIENELEKYDYPEDRMHIVPTTEVIDMAEPPVNAIRTKKDSSMAVGLKMLHRGEADAFVSSGSTGAILVGGQMLVGRLKGVERAPLAALVPRKGGVTLLLDSGANVDARASHLVQFAKMGNIYMRDVMGISMPRVALVNIGEEEEKGNALVKETYPLLKECTDMNFIGSIEARDITADKADVVVCEAFVGNVILKFYEGAANLIIEEITNTLKSSLKTQIGALFVKNDLKKTLNNFDASKYGGAPLLGLKGLVVKAHGSATHSEIRNSILQCRKFKKQRINEKISENLS